MDPRKHYFFVKSENYFDKWHKEQIARAFNEHYFAVTMGSSPEEIGPALSNYHIWWRKFKEAIDPNGVSPEVGALA